MKPKITVAICSHNRYELLSTLLPVFSEQKNISISDFEILIIDNSDSLVGKDNFYSLVECIPNAKVISSQPPGLSRARNEAIKHCQTPYIVYIDDDAIPGDFWLSSLLYSFQNDAADVIAGPISPLWSIPRPEWLPEKYAACLTILNYGDQLRTLGEFEYAYGTNMAFRLNLLKEVGGFKESLGRVGSRTLISEEEIETQILIRKVKGKFIYNPNAIVFHRVHENRISRSYIRARMAWQAVSVLMHDSPHIHIDASRVDLMKAAQNLGVEDFLERMLVTEGSQEFSDQLDIIYNLFLLILDSKDLSDSVFEKYFYRDNKNNSVDIGNQHRLTKHNNNFDEYRFSLPIASKVKHLFVEGKNGHNFLFNTFGRIKNSQMFNFSCNSYEVGQHDYSLLKQSLTINISTITFLSLDALAFGSGVEHLHSLIQNNAYKYFGFLHRFPENDLQRESLVSLARQVKILVLSKRMETQLREVLGIEAAYIPLPSQRERYIAAGLKRNYIDLHRQKLGVKQNQIVISLLGEMRNEKGIHFMLDAIRLLEESCKNQLFFLFAGHARDIKAEEIEQVLKQCNLDGFVDVRQNMRDPRGFEVLSDLELSNYVLVSDVGIYPYTASQRLCASGSIPDYIRSRKFIIAGENTEIGDLARNYDLGLVYESGNPGDFAKKINDVVKLSSTRKTLAASTNYEKYFNLISTENVLEILSGILDSASGIE